MSSLSTTIPTTGSIFFRAPRLVSWSTSHAHSTRLFHIKTLFYASCDSANSSVQIWKEPLNVTHAYKSTPSVRSLASQPMRNTAGKRSTTYSQISKISTPADFADEANSHCRLSSFFRDAHFECELSHPRPKAYSVATKIMIREFEAIAQKEAEGVEKAWEWYYNTQYCWPGRSDSDEIVDITNELAHRCSSAKTAGRKWCQVLKEKQTTRQHLISPAPSTVVYNHFQR